jgi:hypothetical protein
VNLLATPAALILGTVLLAGCGGGGEEPREPLVMRPAPAAGAGKLDLDLPRDPSGAFAFDRWPKACGLLTDGEIKAVLPQVTKVEREAEDQEIKLLEPISNDVGVPAPPRTVTAKGAICTYKLKLPAAGLSNDRLIPASLRVEVDYAGTPAAVKKNFLVARDDKRIAVPDGQCHGRRIFAGVSCRKRSLAFSITSYFDHLVQETGESRGWTDRYRVAGKTTTFTSDGSLDDAEVSENSRRETFRRDHLDAELAKTVLAKVEDRSR